MNITVGGQTSEALNDVIRERLTAALGQHESWVDSVHVKVADENGPRGGGLDKLCRIDVTLRGGMSVLIEQRGDDFYVIVNEAAERAKQVVGRKIARRRSVRAA